MTKHSILDEIPEVVRDKVQRALRNIAYIARLTGERHDEELAAAMTQPEESLDELRRICARKGIDADAVIALLSQNH
jgi:predicted RNA binding protein with dsRBD fold (UPF0201 family)